MAKQTLPTNFKDDVLNTSMGGKRKWNITQNSDGTYSITDVTDYSQVGSEFGAGELNATNQAVNESADAGKIIDDPDTAGATTQNGYIAGVQLFNHVNDSLLGFPDYGNVIATINTANASYTATQNGWLIGTVRQSKGNSGAYALVNGIQVIGIYTTSSSSPYPLTKGCIPINKGDVITTYQYGTYDLSLYGFK